MDSIAKVYAGQSRTVLPENLYLSGKTVPTCVAEKIKTVNFFSQTRTVLPDTYNYSGKTAREWPWPDR